MDPLNKNEDEWVVTSVEEEGSGAEAGAAGVGGDDDWVVTSVEEEAPTGGPPVDPRGPLERAGAQVWDTVAGLGQAGGALIEGGMNRASTMLSGDAPVGDRLQAALDLLQPAAPIGRALGSGVVAQAQQQAAKAKEAFARGSNVEGVGRVGAAALPFVGPAAARVGELAGAGDFAGALTRGVLDFAPVAAPAKAIGVAKAAGRGVRGVADRLGLVGEGVLPRYLTKKAYGLDTKRAAQQVEQAELQGVDVVKQAMSTGGTGGKTARGLMDQTTLEAEAAGKQAGEAVATAEAAGAEVSAVPALREMNKVLQKAEQLHLDDGTIAGVRRAMGIVEDATGITKRRAVMRANKAATAAAPQTQILGPQGQTLSTVSTGAKTQPLPPVNLRLPVGAGQELKQALQEGTRIAKTFEQQARAAPGARTPPGYGGSTAAGGRAMRSGIEEATEAVGSPVAAKNARRRAVSVLLDALKNKVTSPRRLGPQDYKAMLYGGLGGTAAGGPAGAAILGTTAFGAGRLLGTSPVSSALARALYKLGGGVDAGADLSKGAGFPAAPAVAGAAAASLPLRDDDEQLAEILAQLEEQLAQEQEMAR